MKEGLSARLLKGAGILITTHMGSLSAAHRGYAYQDLVTAYLLVRALVHQHEAVTVDRKTVEDDRFDDLEVTANGTRIRRQWAIA